MYSSGIELEITPVLISELVERDILELVLRIARAGSRAALLAVRSRARFRTLILTYNPPCVYF